jgi:hypothetical protein
MELGFQAARRASLSSVCLPLQRALLEAPTGLVRMSAFLRLATWDDTVLVSRMRPEGDRVRLICDIGGLASRPLSASPSG